MILDTLIWIWERVWDRVWERVWEKIWEKVWKMICRGTGVQEEDRFREEGSGRGPGADSVKSVVSCRVSYVFPKNL